MPKPLFPLRRHQLLQQGTKQLSSLAVLKYPEPKPQRQSTEPAPVFPDAFEPLPAQDVPSTTEPEAALSPSVPAPEVLPQTAWDWVFLGRILTAVWLLGMTLGLGSWLTHRIAMRRLVHRTLDIQEIGLLQTRDEIASALKIAHTIPVRCSGEVMVPQTTGIWHPIVLLPAGYGRWDTERLRVSLAHEMAHIARHDVLWQSLAQLTSCLYWPHPVIWIASWRMRVEREHACDDAVLAVGTGPTEYAHHLVELASALKSSAHPSSAAVAMAAHSEVETRIRAILKPGLRRGPVRRSIGIALILFAILATTAAGLLRPSFAGEDKAEVKTEVAAATEEKNERKPLEQKIQLSGTLVDEKGQSVPKAVVRIEYQYGQESIETTTNAEGRFVVKIPYRKFDLVKLITPIDILQRIAYTKVILADDRDPIKNIRLQLEPGRSMEIHVVDVQGKPVAEAKSAVVIDESLCIRQTTQSDGKAKIWLPKQGAISQVYAWKPKLGFDYKDIDDVIRTTKNGLESFDLSQPITLSLTGATTISVLLLDRADDTPIKNTLIYPWLLGKRGERSINLSLFLKEFASKTDDQGVAHFDWMPNWFDDSSTLVFWPVNSEYTHERAIYPTYDQSRKVTMRLSKLVPIRGQVLHPDGKSIEGIRVVARGVGYGLDGEFSEETRTDQEGRYEIKAAPNQLYTVLVDDQKWASVVKEGLLLKPNQPKDNVDFIVRPASRVYGKVIFGPSGNTYTLYGVKDFSQERQTRNVNKSITPEQGKIDIQLGDVVLLPR